MSRRKPVVVRRHYAVDDQACALALKTLLEKSRRGDAGGRDGKKGVQYVPAEGSISR